jgi:hypothetical protein
MSLRMLSFNQIVEPERRRWIPCRCVLSKDDQEACDRMFACAKEPLHAEVQLGRPWRLEVMLMAVLSAHAKRLEQARTRVEAISVEKHLREWNPPT